MLNPVLDILADYPFDRLRVLLDGTSPPAGVRPLALSLGEPQHAPPALLGEILAANGHDWGRYPPVDGTPALRRAAADWLARHYRLPSGFLDPDSQILPVSGTREALYLMAALAVPETKGGGRPVVLLPNPFYHVYWGASVLAEAEPRFVTAGPETGFVPDFTALEPDVLKRTALAYLCSPSNPQGAVADLETLKAAVRLAREYDFLLAVDECYAEIYPDAPPPGALEACAALGEDASHVIVLHSLSKRSNLPGLRSGFVAGDARAIRRFKRLRSYAGATVPLPVQAASAALWADEAHVEANRTLYRAKFEAADAILGDRFGHRRPGGGFFLWLDVGDGEAAARKLWAGAGLRVLPGAYMARPDASGLNPGARYIRVALVHDLETTRAALADLVKVLSTLELS